MNILQLCGIALVAFAAIEILGKEQQTLGMLVGLCGACCLLLPAVLSLTGLLSELTALTAKYRFFGAEQLFRAFGIGLCCEVTADVCSEAGKKNLANALEFACKASILLLCLPLWKEIFSFAAEVMP